MANEQNLKPARTKSEARELSAKMVAKELKIKI